MGPDPAIGRRLRELRRDRRWSQSDLAARLCVSQPHLSDVERGEASLTAEVFLRALRALKVGVDAFDVTPRETDAVQNALARLGASQLVDDGAPLLAGLERPVDVLTDVLAAPRSPRHVTALAPVLIAQSEHIVLPDVAVKLGAVHRAHRLGWFVESLAEAVGTLRPATRAADRRDTKRALLAVELFSQSRLLVPPPDSRPVDPLDPDLRSVKSVERVFAGGSPQARRWRIATSITTADFAEALEAARANGR